MTDHPCVFCQIVGGERPADVLYQDDTFVAFHDIRPAAPVHVLLVPRKHIRSLNDLDASDKNIVAEMIFKAKEIARMTGIDRSGYKLVFNTERGAGQVIFHLHIHLIGGWPEGWSNP